MKRCFVAILAVAISFVVVSTSIADEKKSPMDAAKPGIVIDKAPADQKGQKLDEATDEKKENKEDTRASAPAPTARPSN